MDWLHYLSYFFGGVFLSNAIPHFVVGTMGRSFQSPFGKPPGKGLSSSKINVIWGGLNFFVAYLLILRVGTFDIHSTLHASVFGAGFFLKGLGAAHQFGKYNGGNSPEK